jgi:hypothetical protein
MFIRYLSIITTEVVPTNLNCKQPSPVIRIQSASATSARIQIALLVDCCLFLSVMHALVLQSNGGSGGERIPTHIVIKNSPFIIGKGSPDSPVDCTLYESFISRRHAELRFESDGSCSIRDLGSSNGVYVNKVRVLFRKLVSGDIVQFGGLKNAPVGEVLKSSFASLVYEYDANFSVARNNKRPIGESKGFEQNKAQCTAIAAVSPALISANALDATAPMQASFSELKIEREKWNAERNSLKNELEMSKKTIAEMKKACEERSVQIQERDATIAELNAQRSRLQSAQSAAKKTEVDLRQRIAILENELNDMRRCVAESDSEVKKLRATIASNAASSANVAAAVPKSGISGETLSNSLQCTLCEDRLVEPVVLTCSHGFCRACIASHWSKAAQKSRNGFAHASSNSGTACRCPRCNAVQPKRPGETSNCSLYC